MDILAHLPVILLAMWAAGEAVIDVISFANRFRGPSEGADRFSFFAIWLSVAASLLLTEWIQRGALVPHVLPGIY